VAEAVAAVVKAAARALPALSTAIVAVAEHPGNGSIEIHRAGQEPSDYDPFVPSYSPPRLSSGVAGCEAILNAPRSHTKAQVDYCLSVQRG